jgi:signal peptidase II
MPTLAWVVLGAAMVVCVDQASKALLLSRVTLDRSIRIGKGVRLHHVVNAGWIHRVRSPTRLVLLWSTAVACGLIVLELGGSFEGGAVRAGVAIAVGGATGNLLDRLVRGHVVDFIEIGVWPTFNVADAGIVAGIGLILVAPVL